MCQAAACTLMQSGPLAVINVSGRVYLDGFDCPFRTIDHIHGNLPDSVKYIIVDFHGEATSEKIAFGCYLDGRVSIVARNPHSCAHSRSADSFRSTAYVTDLGMCGPLEGVLGVEKEQVIGKFLTQMPTRFKVTKAQLSCGILADLDDEGPSC